MKISKENRASNGWALRSLLLYPLGSLVAVVCFTIIFYAVSAQTIDTKGLKQTAGLREAAVSGSGYSSRNIVVYCPGNNSPQFRVGGSASGEMLWDPQQFLTITLGFGRFTFAQAKALDFAWDLVVGSGGQALAINLVYPLFRRMLLAHMETRPISIQAYTSVAFDGIAMGSFWTILRGSLPHSTSRTPRSARQRWSVYPTWRTLRGWFFWLGALSVLAYLLAFGKVLSLMTGYQAIADAVITPEGSTNLISVSDVLLRTDWLLVQDGSRVGLQDRFIVNNEDPNWAVVFDYALTYSDILTVLPQYRLRPPNDIIRCKTTYDERGERPINKDCVFFAAPLGEFGPVWSNITLNRTGTLHTTTLSTPLNITGWGLASSTDYMTSVGFDQLAVRMDYLYANTKCLPTADYEWGFSSLLLFTFRVASILFLLVLQSMAWLVYDRSRSDRLQHPINVYQDAFDIVQELKHHYGEELDAAGIKKKIRKNGASMSLDLEGLPESRHTERQRAGRRSGKRRIAVSWFRRNKDSKELLGATSTNPAQRHRFGGSQAAEETLALRPLFNRQTSSTIEIAAETADSEMHTGGDDAHHEHSTEQPAAAPYTRLDAYEGT
ncbi:hypothetical protein LTR17_016946 [Elasticomyces elasticus]|nr:hypothetical protein LTR17_016946 [Elasticomyces elasticus]